MMLSLLLVVILLSSNVVFADAELIPPRWTYVEVSGQITCYGGFQTTGTFWLQATIEKDEATVTAVFYYDSTPVSVYLMNSYDVRLNYDLKNLYIFGRWMVIDGVSVKIRNGELWIVGGWTGLRIYITDVSSILGSVTYYRIIYSVDVSPILSEPPILQASIDIDPDVLNLKSKGRWVTCNVELPEGYDIHDINFSTILLNETITAEPSPTIIVDFDNDLNLDLMVKFERAEVISSILTNVNMNEVIKGFTTISLTVTGLLNDRTPFTGTDIIRIK
jgi:hypothetical protein